MATRNDGGPAFPVQTNEALHAGAMVRVEHLRGTDGYEQAYLRERGMLAVGMSLRDYFAGLAIAKVPEQQPYNMKPNESFEDYVARRAYAMADAMLKARAE